MLTSIALIFLCGLFLGGIFQKLKLPGLLGMLVTGMILGPYALDVLDGSLLGISGDLRQLALVIILTRAGLTLNFSDLKKIGRPAVLMCFLPACLELVGVVILAPVLLGVSVLEAAIMGSVIAAVSPAVIVPRMIQIMEEGYGREKSIPHLILAGASMDDVFVIVLFTAFMGYGVGEDVSPIRFVEIPVSILLGIFAGLLIGICLVWFFKKFHMRDSVKILIILGLSFLLLEAESRLEDIVPFSALLAIMGIGIMMKQKYDVLAIRLSGKYNKLWVGAEVMLFVLIGAAVDLEYAVSSGAMALVLVLLALVCRTLGVLICLTGTKLNAKERLFCVLAYIPKATVQAAIGAIPLSAGLACGPIVLSVAVLSILVTAPIGAICIDASYKKLLMRGSAVQEDVL